MQTDHETPTSKSYVVVERDHRGWTIVGGKLYGDRVVASMAAANIENAIVLPARRRRLHLEAGGGQPEQKTVINVDWGACTGTGRQASESWYAVRVGPDAQRMAKRLLVPANASQKDLAELDRRNGETIVERNLREKGIDVYMPAFWQERRVHRGGKLRSRRLPFLVGYVFIRYDAGLGFEAIRKIRGVIDIVCVGDRPVAISEEDVRFIMITMFDRHQAYLFQKAQNTEEARFKRRQTLNADLGRHLPKGRGRTVSLRVYADECMGKLPKDARKKILGIISAIDGLEDDTALDEFRKPVYFPDRDD